MNGKPQRPGWQMVLLHEDLLLVWPGLFFLGLGLLLTLNGVEQFYQPGGHSSAPRTGTPAGLYWLGGAFMVLAAVRALLFRLDRAKQARRALTKAANARRKLRRRAGRR